jgi:dynein heavy chain
LQQANRYIGGQVIREKVKNPLFKADIILAIPNISIKPTLDDMQSQLNKSIQAMLRMSQDVPEWRHATKLKDLQIREIEKQAQEEGEDPKAAVAAKAPKPLHKIIAEHKDVNKLVISLSSCMSGFKDEVQEIMKNFTGFAELWEKEPEPTVKEFMTSKPPPLIVDIEAKFRHYKKLQIEIEEFPQTYQVGSIIYMTDNLKRALLQEISNWKLAYGKELNNKAASDMKNLLDLVEDIQKRLARPCKDLDDIRLHMSALNQIKEKEIEIDRTITPIEETYAMLNKYDITFNDGNAEKVDSLTYGWKTLNEKAKEVQNNLVDVQPNFKGDLLSKVTQFKKDVEGFNTEYIKK